VSRRIRANVAHLPPAPLNYTSLTPATNLNFTSEALLISCGALMMSQEMYLFEGNAVIDDFGECQLMPGFTLSHHHSQ